MNLAVLPGFLNSNYMTLPIREWSLYLCSSNIYTFHNNVAHRGDSWQHVVSVVMCVSVCDVVCQQCYSHICRRQTVRVQAQWHHATKFGSTLQWGVAWGEVYCFCMDHLFVIVTDHQLHGTPCPQKVDAWLTLSYYWLIFHSIKCHCQIYIAVAVVQTHEASLLRCVYW